MSGFVYIMASRKNGTLYTGVTSDLLHRVFEHKDKAHPNSFTAKYNVNRLVWYQEFDDITDAIAHEKRVKKWRRIWKIEMIEADNPEWDDLYPLLRE
jgi:putative endonuclease